MRGRPRKPTATIELERGRVYEAHYGDRTHEPEFAIDFGPMPSDFGPAARQIWETRTAELIEAGVLKSADWQTWCLACRVWESAQFTGMPTPAQRWAIGEWRRFAAIFGLSPADRSRVAATPPKAKEGLVGIRKRA